ncbi:Hypp1198 [Branchiostoma lanceolatum]|uniref:Hypp1198 protein n=1 Tax=Branchiostoma lanceolatum TaxID=7740 RepID=A0A8K0ELX7_BRALA|nr:Hypp1198 [Branchiostoma lanceolatum]
MTADGEVGDTGNISGPSFAVFWTVLLYTITPLLDYRKAGWESRAQGGHTAAPFLKNPEGQCLYREQLDHNFEPPWDPS